MTGRCSWLAASCLRSSRRCFRDLARSMREAGSWLFYSFVPACISIR